MITDYHSQLFANELTLRAPTGTVERIAVALMDSRIDLNPHQIDAAVFAFKSQFSKGAMLADEVGLGKTIEAGILITQKWAEKKHKIIIVVPANLRKQWMIEIEEKFALPSVIMESKYFNDCINKGKNPFDTDKIIITSYNFAHNKEKYIANIRWDLAVIDEAHRLRNVYKSNNKISNSIKSSLLGIPKILLTATPLQNNLMELFGLIGIIDDHVFGDERSFRELFLSKDNEENLDDLRKRLQNICKRTLRKQVLKYIKYTKRHAYTQTFKSTKEEDTFYNEVSEYLRRDTLYAFPRNQRKLMTMVMRKLLASSTFAITGTFKVLIARLEAILNADEKSHSEIDIENDFETANEYQNTETFDNDFAEENEDSHKPLSKKAREEIKQEIADLKSYLEKALAIKKNSKGQALLIALKEAFKKAKKLGASDKAVIFTESRRTQQYLFNLLSENGYKDNVVLFNGTNNEKTSEEIYQRWCENNPNRVPLSKSAEIRNALVEHFRDNAKIMIATEAAAEGINLQFCSLVVNYDLPWNPQRIEQRIGRCHRYGQKYDVVVVNFLNVKNEADVRVFEILENKLKLFEGVFGVSDEILGAIGNGVDFENKIAEIYQSCRTSKEIQSKFDEVQEKFANEIGENMRSARQKLLENFDSEVAERLNVFHNKSSATIDKMQILLWELTKHELQNNNVYFNERDLSFEMPTQNNSGKKIYAIKRSESNCEPYGISHPIADNLIKHALDRKLPDAQITFIYDKSVEKIPAIEKLSKRSGKLMLSKITIGDDDKEEHLVLSCIDNVGNVVEQDTARQLFNLNAKVEGISTSLNIHKLNEIFEKQRVEIINKYNEKTESEFEEEVEKLDNWSSDRKTSLELKILEIDKKIIEIKKIIRTHHTMEEKLLLRKKQRALETERTTMRRKLYDAQDTIDAEHDKLIDNAEKSFFKPIRTQTIFAIEWKISNR